MASQRFIPIVVAFFTALPILQGWAQTAKTPFSSFGVGQFYNRTTAYQLGMGGLGIGTPGYVHFNTLNPALMVHNKLTTLEAGFRYEHRQLSNRTQTEQSDNGGFNYFVLGLPIKSGKWTMGIGLTPYSRTEYKLDYLKPIDASSLQAEMKESRTGGIDELYWSNGVALTKALSIGIEGSYFFGSIKDDYNISLTQGGTYSSSMLEKRSFSGFGFSAGLAYHLDSLSKKNHELNIGITYRSEGWVNTVLNRTFEGRTQVSAAQSTTLTTGQRSTTVLPQSIAAGVSFGKWSQWLVGVDFSYTVSSLFTGLPSRQESFTDSWKLSLGGRIIPNGASEKYLRRITYQTGATAALLPYLINGNPVYDLGWSLGLSLPVMQVSSVNLAFSLGKQGNEKLNGIGEFYFKLYCGIVFTDRWFIKRRFD